MKVTIEKLNEWKTDRNLTDSVIEYFKDNDEVTAIKKLIEDNKVKYANWILCRMLDKKQKVKLAVFAAEQVLTVFEKRYPKDKRPRIAIKRAKEWLDNPTKQNIKKIVAISASEAHAAGFTGDCVYANSYAAFMAAHVAAYAAQIAGSDSEIYDAILTTASVIATSYAYAFAYIYSEVLAIVESDADAYAFADVYAFTDFDGLKKQMQIKLLLYGLKLLIKNR